MGSKVIFDFVAEAKRQGKSVIVSTHRMEEAEHFCDRFGLLHRGQLLHEGTLGELQKATGCRSLTEIFLNQIAALPREELAAE